MPKARITPKNIKKFITGWYRWCLYKLQRTRYIKAFEDYNFLPTHQQEQFQFRIMTMDQECLESGACKICGCKTPQLQLADEPCDGNCYPEMMSKEDWKTYKQDNHVIL